MTVTRQQAAWELYRRRMAAENIISYAEFIDVPGRPATDDEDCDDFKSVETNLAPHHKLILEAAEKCFLTPYGRLMIFMPPGSAKSTYASVVAPSYLMGKYKKTRVGLFSYGSSLAKKMGRRTRSILKQPRYSSIMRCDGEPVMLRSDSTAVDNFVLTNGSEYMAAGILGAATGNRFELLVIDDPVKGREDADSEVIRNKTHEAFTDDLQTRLVPGGSIMIIQTRWHEDDLAGRILPTDWNGESGEFIGKDGMKWTVLCLQAECETDSDPLGRKRGEMLWAEWFTPQHWEPFRRNQRSWGSLCQQIPRPRDGNLFLPDRINIVDTIPAGRIKWVRGWDLAATEGGGKYTVGFLVGIPAETGRPFLADVQRFQHGPGKRDQRMVAIAREDGRNVTQDIPDDPGAGGTAQTEYIVKGMKGVPVVFGPESGDKETRATPIAAEVNIGNVDMLRADWNKEFIAEARTFPNGTFTDQIDALSRAYTRLVPLPGKMRITNDVLSKVRNRQH